MARLPVALAEEDAVALLRPMDEISALVPNELPDEAVQRDVVLYSEELSAPLAAGTVLGEIRVSVAGEVFGTSKLVNSSAIELSRSSYLTQRVTEILSRGWVIALLIILFVFALIYITLVVRYRRLRRKHLRERKLAEKRRREERERAERGEVTPVSADPEERFDFPADVRGFFDDEEE